jgi:hypothetical protein
MSKILYENTAPSTQSVEAVKSLLTWRGHPTDPMPASVELGQGENRVVLVLNGKRDAYYTVTSRSCSCPSATYRPGKTCKHRRVYFPPQATLKAAEEPADIRPDMRGFRPFSLLPGEVEEDE